MSTDKLIPLVARLPLPSISLLGWLFGWLLWLTPNKKRRVCFINIGICLPHLSAWKRSELARKSLINECLTLLEIPRLMRLPQDKVLSLIKNITGEAYLEQGIQKGNGVILAIPHLGNWEMIGFYGSSRYPMTSLYRTQRHNPILDQYIRNGRQRFGANLVPTDTSGVRAIYKSLTKNHLVAILPDQNPGNGKGVFVPFFDHPAKTMTLLPRLAQRNQSTVLLCYAQRRSWGRGFELHFIPMNDDIYNTEEDISAASMNRDLEHCIRRIPEQYWWSYKRFRDMPSGQPSPYE